jgi:integrase
MARSRFSTDNARRHIPVSQRVAAVLEMRNTGNDSPWVFPAPTKSGHIEPSTVKKPHGKACKGRKKKTDEWAVQPFPLYTLRHTCLTRWAPHMDLGH